MASPFYIMVRVKDEMKKLAILAASKMAFAEMGIFKTRITDIAKLAGVASGTVYLYFKDKEDIIAHIAAEDKDFIRNYIGVRRG